MGKKIIGIVVALVVVAGLAVTLILLNRTPATADSSEPTSVAPAVYVIDIGEAAVEKVEITNDAGGMTVLPERDGDTTTYVMAGYEDFVANASTLGSIYRNAGHMTAKSVIGEDADLATYGLDKPMAQAVVTVDDGTTHTLNFGSAAPGSEGYYVSVDDGKTVYLVTSSTVNYFLNGPLSLLDKTLTAGDATVNAIETAELGGTVRPQPIVIRPVEESDNATYTTHVMTAPIRADVDTTRGVEVLATAMGLSATEVVAANPDDAMLEEYGLLEPYSTLNLTAVDLDEPIALKASAPDADGNVYLMKDGTDLVYKIAASSLPWLSLQYHDIMSRLVILPFIDDVSRVTVTTPDESHTFELSGEGKDLVVTTADGQALDSDIFRKFYQELLSARYDSTVEEAAAEAAGSQAQSDAPSDADTSEADGSAADNDNSEAPDTAPDTAARSSLIPEDAVPLLTFTYEYRDGRAPNVVSFYSGPTRKAYITLNDGIPYLIPIGYVESILPNLNRLLAGEAIIAYMF